tara:strand:- start:6436 stop:7392 length:957 start_codon:yes stop_codon:yes gene_type:complete
LIKDSKIYVAGHTGMVGGAILRCLNKKGYNNTITRTHDELNLIDQVKTKRFFNNEMPEYVFVAAGKVGGILANSKYKGQFLYENLCIQNNIIHFAHETGVRKLIFLGSACIYPRASEQPIKESSLLSGYLEPTNEPYAIAKIAGIKMCQSYHNQYGDNFISLMPNNLYGPNDNFDLETSHVVPAMVRKIHEAKITDNDKVEIWGSGKPFREFLHVDDLADAVVYLFENINSKELYKMGISHINVGSGDEISIKNLAILIKDIIGFEGDLIFNSNKPDGMPRKVLDCSLLNKLGWKRRIHLSDGIRSLYSWYKNQSDSI